MAVVAGAASLRAMPRMVLILVAVLVAVGGGAWLVVRPAAGPPPAVSTAEAAVPARVRTLCLNCHVIDGRGGTQGPALDGIAQRMAREEILRWIANPQAVKPGTAMPNLGLSSEERAAVVAWLSETE